MIATGALIVVPAACSDPSDTQVFGQTTFTVTPADETSTTSPSVDTTETSSTSTVVDSTSTTTPALSTSALPAGSEMTIDFTYTASGGRVRNPYIAVWLEDTQGNMVSTVYVWYQSSHSKYLNHLRSWVSAYSAAPSTYSPSTGATRSPGAYSAVWDGTDTTGTPVRPGDYILFVEAAREHGPHSISSAPIALDGSSLSVTLADAGELNGISAAVKV